MKNIVLSLLVITLLSACKNREQGIPVIGFLDAIEDETISRAKKGFFKALQDSGLVNERDFQVIYRNAQGDIPTLIQACDYFVSEKVDLIATNTTLSTITAVQKTQFIPICMMVSPSPELAGLRNEKGRDPKNLFGVYETLEYIDTAAALITIVAPQAQKIGVIYNQSEPQSKDALMRITKAFSKYGTYKIIAQGITNSSETFTAIRSLTDQNIDLFFALPDNTIFASFETILQACNEAKVPIITSESGLVVRGATAGFGADMYDWGYEAGIEAAKFLKTRKISPPKKLTKRVKMFNKTQAALFNLNFDESFQSID